MCHENGMMTAPTELARRSRLALVALLGVAVVTACRSKPATHEEPAPRASTSVTSASRSAVPLGNTTLPLLGEGANARNTGRIVTVKRVTTRPKKGGDVEVVLAVQNVVDDAIVSVDGVRLYAYDAAGKAVEHLYLENGEKEVEIAKGASATLAFSLAAEEAAPFAKAKTLEAEVSRGRLKGAPAGAEWFNENLTPEERPRGGLEDAALRASAAVTVRAVSFDPRTGTARLRNDGKRATRRLVRGTVAPWDRPGLALRTMSPCDVRDVVVNLPPGEERDVSLVTEHCPLWSYVAKSEGALAFSVDFASVLLDDGSEVRNSNLGYNIGWTRPARDLDAAVRR
jgi:hypothetical protein